MLRATIILRSNTLVYLKKSKTLGLVQNLVKTYLTICQGPETSFGASNFIPSWMFWQKLPRQLQYPKTVILHRRDGTSWGFSIVGEFNQKTENMFLAPSSVEKSCTERKYSMHFSICPQKNFKNADIYFISHKESLDEPSEIVSFYQSERNFCNMLHK